MSFPRDGVGWMGAEYGHLDVRNVGWEQNPLLRGFAGGRKHWGDVGAILHCCSAGS